MRWFDGREIGRNDNCLCGSGLKFKHCCIVVLEKKSEEILSHQQVGSYLVYEELWPRGKNSPEMVREILSDFEPLDLILTLSKVSVIMRDSFYKPIGSAERGLINVLMNSVERKKIDFWIQSGRKIKVITRQSLLAAMQMALLQANRKKDRHIVTGNVHKLGEAILRLNSFLENDSQIRISSDLKEKSVVAAMVLRMLVFNHRLSLGPSIGRYWSIIKKGLPEVKNKYPKQFFDFETAFRELFGFSFEQMLGQAFAIWGHYSKKNLEQILNDPKEFLLGESYFKNVKREVLGSVKAVFGYSGIDLPKLCDIVEKEISSFALPNHYAFSAFWDHPLLRIGEEAYFPVDLIFLENKMTQGIYWSLFNEFLKKNENKKLELMRESFGHAIEWYVGQHLKKTITDSPNQKDLWLEWNEEVEGVDAVVKEGNVLFLIEVTSSGLKYKTRIGCAPDKIETELRQIWFGKDRNSAKLYQLSEAFERTKKNELKIRDLDYSQIKSVVPVLITLQGFPLDPFGILSSWYGDLMKENNLTDEFIQNLIFLDLEELEILCHSKQEGKIWHEMLAKRKKSPFRYSAVGDFMFFEIYNGEVPVSGLTNQWMEEAIVALKGALF